MLAALIGCKSDAILADRYKNFTSINICRLVHGYLLTTIPFNYQ